MEVEFADEVRFSPLLLEEVGADLIVEQSLAMYEVLVPSMVRVGGNLRIIGNGPGVVEVSARAAEAFEHVEVGGYSLICGNFGGDDPCPQSADCRSYFAEDYCCSDDPCLGHDICPGRTQCSNYPGNPLR